MPLSDELGFDKAYGLTQYFLFHLLRKNKIMDVDARYFGASCPAMQEDTGTANLDQILYEKFLDNIISGQNVNISTTIATKEEKKRI